MNRAKLYLILLLLSPFLGLSQFGPRKKDLALRIDTLQMKNHLLEGELKWLQVKDSLNSAELKKLHSELKDLKKYALDIHDLMAKLEEEHENISKDNLRLKKQYDDLVKKLEIQQILMRKVIGVDSLELFEKKIASENALPPSPEIEKFKTFASNFLADLNDNSEFGLEKYLNESHTFFYLSKPGFITSVSSIKDLNELTEEIPWRIGYDAFKKTKFALQEGEKPIVNCEMVHLYNKRGIYAGFEQDFNKVSKALVALKEFSPDEEAKLNTQIDAILKEETRVVTYIFSTDGNLGFYFMRSGDTWKLFCLEVDDPCSA